MTKIKRKKVLVAISGGIDSSVAAALLKKQGYDVVGVYLRLLGSEAGNDHEKAAGNVAKKIKIPFHIIDLRKEFKKAVINHFLREYKEERTPNPCVVCNREIKFKFLFKALSKLKADCVVTGHYARVMKHETRDMKQNVYKLFEAKDKNKDQSYFLYTLNQKQLSKILFPLGDHTKKEVRKLAKKFKLPVSQAEESQNVCFIPEKYPDDFLKKSIKMKRGNITDIKGNIIGKHDGLPLYTIGQRRGINIGGKGPYFVVAKNLRKNELVVANGKTIPELFSSYANLSDVNWTGIKPKLPAHVLSQTRYHNPKINAIIKAKGGNSHEIIFEKSQRAVTPGQSVVFYSKIGEVIGGGVIIN